MGEEKREERTLVLREEHVIESITEYSSTGIEEYVTTCPLCGAEDLVVRCTVHDIPVLGRTLITSYRCRSCGYTHTDLYTLEQREPLRISYRVEDRVDFETRIVRSRTCILRIPELGVELYPGPIAEVFITNVEGLLTRIEDYTRRLMTVTEDEEVRRRCLEMLQLLEKAKQGQLTFTIVLEDPQGTSTIIPPPERRHKLILEKLSGGGEYVHES